MTDPVLEALNRAAEELTPDDINLIIAHLRKSREGGAKPKKVDAVDLVKELKITPQKDMTGFVRRF